MHANKFIETILNGIKWVEDLMLCRQMETSTDQVFFFVCEKWFKMPMKCNWNENNSMNMNKLGQKCFAVHYFKE